MDRFLRAIRRWLGFLKPLSLVEERGKLTAQTAMLYEIGKAMGSPDQIGRVERTHQLIVEAVTVVLNTEVCLLFLLDPRRGELVLKAVSGMADESALRTRGLDPAEPLLSEILAGGEARLVARARELGLSGMEGGPLIVAPLLIGGEGRGIIVACCKRGPSEFSPEEVKLLTALASLAATAEANAIYYQMQEERAERLKGLFVMCQALNSTLELNSLLYLIMDQAIALMKATSGSILLLGEAKETLTIQAARGLAPEVMRSFRLTVGRGITGWVAKEGRPLRVGDVAADPRYVPTAPNVRSEMAVPMIGEGEVIGVINVNHSERDAFAEKDEELLSTLAAGATVAIRNARLFEKLKGSR